MFKQISIVIIFLIAVTTEVLSQDPIKNYPGIPIITYTYNFIDFPGPEDRFKLMDSAGIFAMQVTDMKSTYYPQLTGTTLQLLPDQINVPLNFIDKYTDAHYTVWEAEGTDTSDGDATLYYKATIGERVPDAVRTKVGINSDTLIYGPYYLQENTYCMVDDGIQIDYQADFILKKETIGQLPNPNDTICVLQVTTSHKKELRVFDSIIVIKETAITYNELSDDYEPFSLQYNLTAIPDSYYREFTNYIEFKVIWKGNSNNVRLYVDKIVLSDDRGRFITDPQTLPIAKQQIKDQIDEFQERVVGWMGIDEPQSIDNYEPIRIVQSIIDSITNENKGLWISFGGTWSGRWDHWNNIGSYKLSMFEEFYKRVKKANIWCSKFLYDVSYPSSIPNYKAMNISSLADSNYRHFQNKENVFWGACVQAGSFSDATSWLTVQEISSQKLLYNVNLALLYGAKIITPWKYFVNTGTGNTGLVNVDPYNNYTRTYKWYTLKDTIAPRLRGLLGKTLKSLTPKSQYAGLSGFDLLYNNTNVNKEYISEIRSLEVLSEADSCFIDLGFFNEQLDSTKKYFMILNRYYSTHSWLQVHLRNLNGFRNWKLTDYVDTSQTTLLADNGGNTLFNDTVCIGDAKLYSILPVVKYGGKLIVDEIIFSPTTLHDDMTIDSGATLYINSTYTANANITVKNGGKIIGGNNGIIVFTNRHQLFIEDSAQVKVPYQTD